jgi:aminodeoxyfutalosine deaminase
LAWLRFSGYRDFINAHVLVCDQLRRPEDFEAVALRLGNSLADQQVRYAEIAISPAAYARRGVHAGELFAALDDARTTVERRRGVRLRWSATAGTRLGPRQAFETVELALAHRSSGVVSIGLAGLEAAASRARFRPAFDVAADGGLHRVVHAGEAAGAESIRQAIDELGAERIGHGIRCLDDPALVDRLRDARVPLEVCLTSNVRTRLVSRMQRHPLPRLLDARLRVSLHTDDPAMFGTSLVDEYLIAARAFRLSARQLADLARSSVSAAFIDPEESGAILAEVDATPLPAELTPRGSIAKPADVGSLVGARQR